MNTNTSLEKHKVLLVEGYLQRMYIVPPRQEQAFSQILIDAKYELVYINSWDVNHKALNFYNPYFRLILQLFYTILTGESSTDNALSVSIPIFIVLHAEMVDEPTFALISHQFQVLYYTL